MRMSLTPPTDQSYDPRTMHYRHRVPHSAPAEVTAILRRASVAADALAGISPLHRSRRLGAVADSLLEHRQELALLADEEASRGHERPVLRQCCRRQALPCREIEDSRRDDDPQPMEHPGWTGGRVRCQQLLPFDFGAFGAFGAFGHDVASAIAAGCLVLAKAHPAYPPLSLRPASFACQSLRVPGAPKGI